MSSPEEASVFPYIKKFYTFKEPESSLTLSQNTATHVYSQPEQSRTCRPSNLFNINFMSNIIPPSMSRSTNWCISLGFPTKTPSKQLSCLACLILLDFMSRYLVQLRKPWSSATCGYSLTYLLHRAESFLRSHLVLQLVKEFSTFLEPEGSSPYSQVPATYPYPEPTPSSPHKPLQFPEDPS